MPGKNVNPGRREYTLMIVPHNGQKIRQIRIPIKVLKIGAACLGIFILMTIATFINMKAAVNAAKAEREELAALRQVNGEQIRQIEQLAQAASELQKDMSRLNALDAELRRIINSDEKLDTSRGGTVRYNQAGGGQGGPTVKPKVNDIAALVSQLKVSASEREQSLTALKEALLEKKARIAATPSIVPADGYITSRFGWRSSPWGYGSDWHPGVDIANDEGTPICAAADGVVVESGWNGGYGKMIKIDHGNGIETIYAHNLQNLVGYGQRVAKGDIIAYMGSTGYSTGPHLHYEVRVNGSPVNPANFF